MEDFTFCTNCLQPIKISSTDNIVCNHCGEKQSKTVYKKIRTDALKAFRYGYQYRVRYEEDLKAYKTLKWSYYLEQLNPAFEFLATAVVSGIIGNFAYDKLKQLVNKSLRITSMIEIQDEEFQKLLRSEKEREKFIKYIQEYRNKEVLAPPEILKAIGLKSTATKSSVKKNTSPKKSKTSKIKKKSVPRKSKK